MCIQLAQRNYFYVYSTGSTELFLCGFNGTIFIPSYQHTIISIYHHHHHTNIPIYQHTIIPIYHHTNIPSYQYTIIPIYQYTNIPIYQYTNIPSSPYTNITIKKIYLLYLLYLLYLPYLLTYTHTTYLHLPTLTYTYTSGYISFSSSAVGARSFDRWNSTTRL